MKKQPRTVKNSKVKEKELDSLTNSNSEIFKRRRRRRNIQKNDSKRKSISIIKKVSSNKPADDLNESEKNEKLIEIQKQIEKLKIEKKMIIDPSFKSFKSLEEKQIKSQLQKKNKDELLSISNKHQLGLCKEDKKIDIIESIIEKKNDKIIENYSKIKKKKYSFKKFTKEEIANLNSERLQKSVCNNNIVSFLFEKTEGRFFKLIEKVYGVNNFYETLDKYICFWYNNNGWNKEEINSIFYKHDENKLEKIREFLPHQSNEFEIKFLKYFGNENIFLEDEVLILKKWTRKGFCLNIGCKQEFSNCTFVWMYKVYFIPKFKSFKYELLIKGGHDNFLIGEGSKYAKSIITKSLLNDSIKKNKTISEIRKDLREKSKNSNEFNLELNTLTRKTITVKKYNESKKKLGTYETCFNKAHEFFQKQSFKNLQMVLYDKNNLNLIFVNVNPEVYKKKSITDFYIDGTFKTKFWKNSHYVMLVFAINMPGSLVTIPIAFSIGFKGRAVEYLTLWKSLKVVLKKFDVDFSNLRGISDLGKSELCAFNSMDLLNSFYCWWHTLEKCFIPFIDENLTEKIIKNDMIMKIRLIYCSKTLTKRNENVSNFKKLIKGETNLLDYFSNYLKDDVLDKWSSLYKITQYAEHTSNYLESLFGSITNKNIAKQTKLLKFIKSLNDVIDEQLCNHQENKRNKTQSAKIEFEKGYKLYLVLESEDLNNNVFKVPSSVNGEYHIVDIDNWECSCFQFNQNCYACKHIMYILIEKSISKGYDYKSIGKMDVFEFLKLSRKLFVKDKFIDLIDNEEFPVTIGVSAFFSKYKNYKFNKN